MADAASVKFAQAYKALRKAADANPEYFDLAREVLRRHDDGSVLLMHALMMGLQQAYDAGRAGKPVPLPTLVQTSAELKSIANRGDEAEEEPAAAPARPQRVSRTPQKPVTPTLKRIVRRAPK
jgi:hypothetical protein